MQLLWHLLRSPRWPTFAIDYVRPLPLAFRYKYRPQRPVWRCMLSQALHMLLHSRKCHHRTHIHAILHHLIPVFQEKLPKVARGFSLLFCSYRQVKRYYHPAHFEFLSVHGLYNFFLINTALSLAAISYAVSMQSDTPSIEPSEPKLFFAARGKTNSYTSLEHIE